MRVPAVVSISAAAVTCGVLASCAPPTDAVGQAGAIQNATQQAVDQGAIGRQIPESLRVLALDQGQAKVKDVASSAAKSGVTSMLEWSLGKNEISDGLSSLLGSQVTSVVASATSMLFGSVFGEILKPDSDQQQILKALQHIYSVMNERFDQVDQELTNIQLQLNSGFADIKAQLDQANLSSEYHNAQALVDNVTAAANDRARMNDLLTMSQVETTQAAQDRAAAIVKTNADMQASSKQVLQDLPKWRVALLGGSSSTGVIPAYQKAMSSSNRFLTADNYEDIQQQAAGWASWAIMANQIATEYALSQQLQSGETVDLQLAAAFTSAPQGSDSALVAIQKAVPNGTWKGGPNEQFLIDTKTGYPIVKLAESGPLMPVQAGTYPAKTGNATYDYAGDQTIARTGVEDRIGMFKPQPGAQPDGSWAKDTTYVNWQGPTASVIQDWPSGVNINEWIASNTSNSAASLKLQSLVPPQPPLPSQVVSAGLNYQPLPKDALKSLVVGAAGSVSSSWTRSPAIAGHAYTGTRYTQDLKIVSGPKSSSVQTYSSYWDTGASWKASFDAIYGELGWIGMNPGNQKKNAWRGNTYLTNNNYFHSYRGYILYVSNVKPALGLVPAIANGAFSAQPS